MRRYFDKLRFMAIIVAIVLVAATYAVSAQSVMVLNWQGLMDLAKQQVTQVITNKMQGIWDKEVAIKLRPGSIPSQTFKPAMQDFGQGGAELVRQTGDRLSSFSASPAMQKQAQSDWSSLIARPYTSIPSASEAASSPQAYIQKTREVAGLVAGSPNYRDISKLSTPEAALAKVEEVRRQYNVQAFDQAGQSVALAESLRAELKKFSPQAIDAATPEQAVKDLVKLEYIKTRIAIEELNTLGKSEMRNAFNYR